MLIRFLSYIASIIGAKRYKPLLISCLAVVLSISGVGFVVSALNNGSPKAASQEGQGSKTSATQPASTSPTNLNGLQQKSTKQDNSQSVQQPTQQNTPSSPDNRQSSSTDTSSTNTTFDINLNTSTVNLTKASPTAAVAVTPTGTNTGNFQWTVTPTDPTNANTSGLNVTIEAAKDNSGNAVIRLRADNINPGAYTFTVNAKDTHGTTASKTLTVTVN